MGIEGECIGRSGIEWYYLTPPLCEDEDKVVGDVMVDYFVDVNQMLYLWMIICILFEQPGVLEEM